MQAPASEQDGAQPTAAKPCPKVLEVHPFSRCPILNSSCVILRSKGRANDECPRSSVIPTSPGPTSKD